MIIINTSKADNIGPIFHILRLLLPVRIIKKSQRTVFDGAGIFRGHENRFSTTRPEQIIVYLIMPKKSSEN